MSGSISRGKNDPSQSLQMIERPLLTADELKSLPKGNFVVMKTGVHPMKTKLRLFLDWGITFEKAYETEEKSHRKVYYADKEELEENIIRQTMALDMEDEETEDNTEQGKRGGTIHYPAIEQSEETASKRKAIIRT
ncbi:type IV secretion system protein VirD4 [Ruminiclostridium sufflavum DSM 19573]|uniref:Type IV secretion system protein VirD4 n=1 Tax=Ruminiclostridium sufflavum DSM 19573 TaxID=1121337 RepID=A0A318XHE1_9FIRM|nr:type IV secretion system protein VirD4 [Ruminiclostridium sufflavum DSM 19573]